MIAFKLFIGVFLSIHKTSHIQKKLFLDHNLNKYLNNAKNSIFWDFILLSLLYEAQSAQKRMDPTAQSG